MDLRPAPTSAFSRFSDLLKDTKRRKPSIHQPSKNNASRDNDSLHSRRASRDERRSSSASYTDKLRHMFLSSPQQNISMNLLPVEVLSHILFFLDFWTLLKCQSVCKLWRDLVPGDSPMLHQALYLKPSRDLQIYSWVPATFELDFDVTTAWADGGPAHATKGKAVQLVPRRHFNLSRRCNGLIRTSSEIVFHPVLMDFNVWIEHEDFSDILSTNTENDGFDYSKTSAGSWRNMLVSMPPLRELRLRSWGMKESYRVLNAGEGADGITLGELFRVLDEWSKAKGGNWGGQER